MDRRSDKQSLHAEEPAEDVRKCVPPVGGAGRREEVGGSGVQPVSLPHATRPDAVICGMAEWGQGKCGAAGYQDDGESELIVMSPEFDTTLLTGRWASACPLADRHRRAQTAAGALRSPLIARHAAG
jgi:hypothetical protein